MFRDCLLTSCIVPGRRKRKLPAQGGRGLRQPMELGTDKPSSEKHLDRLGDLLGISGLKSLRSFYRVCGFVAYSLLSSKCSSGYSHVEQLEQHPRLSAESVKEVKYIYEFDRYVFARIESDEKVITILCQ